MLVKTVLVWLKNTKLFCKDTINNMKKDWTGGSRLLLKILYMIPEDRPLVAIGYRYDTQKFLSFINAEYEGSTKAGITYLSNHPYLFANVAILPVNPPL